MNLKLYEQIACIPFHVPTGNNKEFNHPDVEFGFVMSIPPVDFYGSQDYFCRYWRKDNLGELRTVANSERTSSENLRKVPVHSKYRIPQSVVIQAVELILGIKAK